MTSEEELRLSEDRPQAAAEERSSTSTAASSARNGSTSAAAADLTESPRSSEIRQALESLDIKARADIRDLTALAEQISRVTFHELYDRQRQRRGVRNHGGYLRHLLNLAIDEQRHAALAALPVISGEAPPTRIERWKLEQPHDYVTTMAAHLEQRDLDAYLTRYIVDEDLRIELTDLWHDTRRALTT